ncbi:DNA cytosine methyltransferase [Streptococcus mitis]|nr:MULTISPECIES: DNA cytosine methyltransferase [Streptococcus]
MAAFSSGVGGIEFGFEQTNEFRVVYTNEFDKYVRKIYSFNQTIRPTDISDECMES